MCPHPSHSTSLLCATVASASAALGRGAEGSTCSCCQSAIAASHRAFRQSAEKSEQVSALLASASARLELSRVRRVVDVGCGKGHLVSKLRSELGVPALGVDVDDAVLDAAAQRIPKSNALSAVMSSRPGCRCRRATSSSACIRAARSARRLSAPSATVRAVMVSREEVAMVEAAALC